MLTLAEKSQYAIKDMFKFIQQKNERTNYTVGGHWAELKKAWDRYNKAKDDNDGIMMERFARKINNLQTSLKIERTNFY